MEVKINREIRNYTESMFFGLSFRQFVFSLLAVGVAIVLYFALKPHVGTETVSWMCILGAAPFAAMGFISYNGMTAEQFVWAWLRSEMIEPKQIKFEPVNIYYEALKDTIDAKEKEVYKPDAWGNGIGTNILRTFMNYCFESGMNELYTQTWSGNARMLRCAEKLGFVECDRDVGALEIDGQKYDGLTFKINK